MKEDFFCCYFPLHLYSTMTNASKFNLQEGEKPFNEQVYIVSITSLFWIFGLVFFPITNLKVLYVIVTSFFSIYLMLVFCFTITNLKLGYLQVRISHHCFLIRPTFFLSYFFLFFHIVVDVHCHHLWMSKQRIINILIWIIIKSCDA